MSAVSELLLTGLLNHGQLLLGGVLFFAALGLPLPATMLLVAAGAFVRQDVLDLLRAGTVALAAAVSGDIGSYLLGRFGAALVLSRVRAKVPARWQATAAAASAARLFHRWGGWAVFVSRFALTPLALPVNLLAGSTHLAWGTYLAAVVTGEVLWVALFGGLGYLFADRWEVISDLAGDVVGLLLGVALVLVGGLVIGRSRRHLHELTRT
jgi:membrane-associated protein